VALSDTARLISELVLVDKFSANARKYGQSVSTMERQTTTLGRVGGQLSAGIGNAVTNMTRLGLVGVGLLSTQVAAGIQSLRRLEEVTAATNAVLESTRGVAGLTADDIRNLAEKYENLNATMDDKVIQSAQNVLLTFTSIREDAFEPALEAALNMNHALGGGEEGLQGTIIQVGKALQDPIKGITALRRVGVNFSQSQTETIRNLVKENRLFEAQQLILNELAVEFGGQFAAAGDTASGKFARFRDTIEDAQMSLATAFLPALVKVADKLNEFLGDPQVQAAIKDLGVELADAFESLVEFAGRVPWAAVGEAFRIMGTGSKALLDAFTGLPPWVQTAVITGWGLNKLTGGALGSIVNTLASGLVKGILGINAGVVNVTAATVNAPGVPGGPGGTGGPPLLPILLRGGLAAALGVLLGGAVALPETERQNQNAVSFFQEQLRRQREGTGTAELTQSIENLDEQIAKLAPNEFTGAVNNLVSLISGEDTGIVDQLKNQRDILQRQLVKAQQLDHLQRENSAARANDARQSQQFLANIRSAIDRKDFKPTVNVAVNAAVSITDITRRMTSQRIAVGVRGGVTADAS
jgi:hypothetical protein